MSETPYASRAAYERRLRLLKQNRIPIDRTWRTEGRMTTVVLNGRRYSWLMPEDSRGAGRDHLSGRKPTG